jgi:hypothetical protein
MMNYYKLYQRISLFILIIFLSQNLFSQKSCIREKEEPIEISSSLGYSGDTTIFVKNKVLQVLQGISCYCSSYSEDIGRRGIDCIPNGFNVTIFYKDSIYYEEEIEGYLFSNNFKNALKELEESAILIIDNISISPILNRKIKYNAPTIYRVIVNN